MVFDNAGVRLASGSKDTDIIIWDLLAETSLFKLRGHKDQITALHLLQPSVWQAQGQDQSNETKPHGYGFSVDGAGYHNENRPGFLLSTSKDGRIKIWDLASQHCIETHVAQTNGECWAMGISADASWCITGGNDGELKVWSIDNKGLVDLESQINEGSEGAFLREMGVLYRKGKDRTIGVSFHGNGGYIAVHGSEKAVVELWRIRSETEVQKSLARKRRRQREKVLLSGTQDGKTQEELVNGDDDVKDISAADISNVLSFHAIVRTSGKVRSVDWTRGKAYKEIKLLIATTNNQLQLYNITANLKVKPDKSDELPTDIEPISVESAGHRTNIRSMSLSSDDTILASVSNGSLKIWNVTTQKGLRTLKCGYALCVAFLPGDVIVVVGNEDGELEVFDIESSRLIQTVKAHNGAVRTMHVHPDGKSLATGSADKSAKFFNFEVVQEDIPGTRRTKSSIRLIHSRTLPVTDEILSLRFSPDSRLIALSLLDNTVKIYKVDSHQLSLNLYGHSLPVLSMDISYDSKLIVTSSADKTVKLWGLDHGDLHKSLIAHENSIMQVAFVPHNHDDNGHHFWSASKDGVIKYWDGGKFEPIQKLRGHQGEIWALTVSRTGDFIVSASHDKSIRIWKQTGEPIFLEEEREKEMEELQDKILATTLQHEVENGTEQSEFAAAGKQTSETLMAGERIMEALEIGIADLELVREWEQAKVSQPKLAPPNRHPTLQLGNIPAEEYVLNVVRKVKPAHLEDTLLVLRFDQVIALFTFLRIWGETERELPLTSEIFNFLLNMHHSQIVNTKTLRPMLVSLRGHLRPVFQRREDQMGFNVEGLKYTGEKISREKASKSYVGDALSEDEEDKRKKKRAFIDLS